MTDRNSQSSVPQNPSITKGVSKKPDREAGLIHDLATTPPAKDMASVKAASDVFEANRKDRKPEPREKVRARG